MGAFNFNFTGRFSRLYSDKGPQCNFKPVFRVKHVICPRSAGRRFYCQLFRLLLARFCDTGFHLTGRKSFLNHNFGESKLRFGLFNG